MNQVQENPDAIQQQQEHEQQLSLIINNQNEEQIEECKDVKEEQKVQDIIIQQQQFINEESEQVSQQQQQNSVFNKSKNNEMEDYICPICIQIFIDPVRFPCTHVFCKNCIINMFEIGIKEQKCPMCRKVITIPQLKSNSFIPDNFLNGIIDQNLQQFIQKNYTSDYQKRKNELDKDMAQNQNQVKFKLLYGNYHKSSKPIQNLSLQQIRFLQHKWKLYVKIEPACNQNIDLNNYIRQIKFTMPPPFNVVTLKQNPFEIVKSGFGDFEIEIKIFWKKEVPLQTLTLKHELDCFGGREQAQLIKFEQNQQIEQK